MAQRKMPSRKQSARTRRGASKRRPTRARKEITFFDLLQQDHRKVIDLFDQIEEDGEMELDSRGDLFSRIEEELGLHMEGEERFFYPVLEREEETHEKALESYEEHHVARTVLEEFGDLSQDDERWMAKMKVLKEIIAHHVKEEEGQIFKMAKKALDKEQIQEITQQIKEQKGQSAEA